MLRENTHHRLEREDLQRSGFRRRAVAPRRLPAVRRLQLGSPDIRPPPDAREQPGRPAHRVIARAGHLLVPGLYRAARNVRRDDRDNEGECGEHLRRRVTGGAVASLNPLIVSSCEGSPYRDTRHQPDIRVGVCRQRR